MKSLIILLMAVFTSLTALSIIAAENRVVDRASVDWGLLNPARGDASPRAANLWGDRSKDIATGMLVSFPQGFSSPAHIHNISYHGIVIEGEMHNDDPGAESMWLPSGSFWMQPAGEVHVTAANGQNNLIYLEIDSGPYLVQPSEEAFDNGERPFNLDTRNLVWLDSGDAQWLERDGAQIAYLWRKATNANGSFLKLPAGFNGSIESGAGLKAVIVNGLLSYRWQESDSKTTLQLGSFFEASVAGQHHLETEIETMLYINSDGRYRVR
ncbi:MAG: DUF4437 domain-containing protein [Pseudomonadales bacterium]|nr:DUF4437 domain-containing protein [Pseudomonadales bacterium]